MTLSPSNATDIKDNENNIWQRKRRSIPKTCREGKDKSKHNLFNLLSLWSGVRNVFHSDLDNKKSIQYLGEACKSNPKLSHPFEVPTISSIITTRTNISETIK